MYLPMSVGEHSHKHEHSTKWVTMFSFAMMVVEIIVGYMTNSMALLADGWHMASHVFAIGLAWIAYRLTHKHKDNVNFKGGSHKILSLSGYTSAVVLMIVALLMAIESVQRITHPQNIQYKEAIIVAIIGLVVNGVSAFMLHHEDEHGDHNIRAAYLHVLADMITSVLAIGALSAGMFWNIISLDAVCGIISSLVIIKWAVGLIKDSGKELLDYKNN
jgi:cation diffusion facilitator family transporter